MPEEKEVASFDLSGKRYSGEIVRRNRQTIVVMVKKGGKPKAIKRHIVKHHVSFHYI